MNYCALTNKLIIYPVKDKEGNCYEHIEITKWLVNNTISPVTGNPIYITDLIADINMLEIINKNKKNKSNKNNLKKIINFFYAKLFY